MNARFLELDGGNFSGNFEDIFLELRWPCWRNCPRKLQANNFVLNHLVVLKLSGNIITEEWSRWVEIMATISPDSVGLSTNRLKIRQYAPIWQCILNPDSIKLVAVLQVPSRLKVSNLTGSKSLIKTPGFSEFMSLKRSVLKDFPRLVEIDRSIGKLERLIYLKIKCCPRLRELPKEIGCLTALRELILIQGYSVCYLPDSVGNLRLLSRLVMEDTGLVELPDTIRGLVDLEYLCLANCTGLNSLSYAVGELKSLTDLDLSGTTIEELPPSLWNLQVLTFWISGSRIATQLMRYRPLMQDIEYCLDPGRSLGPVGLFKSALFSVRPRDYPREILIQDSRTILAPGFHEHHFSGRSPPKILASVIFFHGRDSGINISVEVPFRNTEVMSSSQPIPYFKNLILMLVSWFKIKWVSKWMHDLQKKDDYLRDHGVQSLLSLEFCNHCMSITSEITEFSHSLESFDLFPELSVVVSMTFDEHCHSDQIGCLPENLEILTRLPPSSLFPSLLPRAPRSSEKLQDSIRV